MKRKGRFLPSKMTDNQCKVKGHRLYNYMITMVFASNAKLDKSRFLIDHIHIDECVQNCYLSGSCEQMHLKINAALLGLFKKKKIPVVGIKVLIDPGKKASANLFHIWTKSRAPLSALAMLNS